MYEVHKKVAEISTENGFNWEKQCFRLPVVKIIEKDGTEMPNKKKRKKRAVGKESVDSFNNFDENTDTLPFALQRLANPSDRRNYDSSGMGVGFVDDADDLEIVHPCVDQMQINEVELDGINEVKNLTVDVFRKKLIEHFDILFKQHQIQWTKRPQSKHVPANI